jgi:CHAT domain-containing protein
LSIALMLLLVSCDGAEPQAASDQLEHAVSTQRFSIGRLAHQTRWAECRVTDTTSLVWRTECGSPPQLGTRAFEQIDSLTRAAREALRDSTSSHALHTLALADFIWYESLPTALDRSVESFQQALRRSPRDAPLLNDASVALLAKAERDGTLRPLLQALDAIERARTFDSTSVSILFNRALILGRLHLLEAADSAWARYLRVERSRPWRQEAERERQRLAARRAIDPFSGSLDSLVAMVGPRMERVISDRVRQSPQAAREFAFVVLSEWSKLPPNDRRARKLLAIARSLGSEIDAARGAHFAVADIEACATDMRCLHNYGAGHAALINGIRAYNGSSFEDAVGLLDSAQHRFGSLRSAASRWAAFYRAAALVSQREYAKGDSTFMAVLDSATDNEPALVGKTMFGVGVSQMRRGNYEIAEQWFRRGLPHVERSGEHETLGYAHYMRTSTLRRVGQTLESQEEALRALAILSEHRGSNYLNNELEQVAGLARDEGLQFAAIAIVDEMLTVARRLRKPEVLALALGTRARDLIEAGRTAEADADLNEAAEWAARMPPGQGLDRIRAIVLLSRAVIVRRTQPAQAIPLFDRVIEAFKGFPQDYFLPTALYEGALASLTLGDSVTARKKLDAAIASLESQQSRLLATELRASFAETVENVFDEMVSLERAGRRDASAFAYIERARAAAWPSEIGTTTRAPDRTVSIGALRSTLAPHTLVLDYALLRDRCVLWAVSRDRSMALDVPAPRDTIAALVGQLTTSLAIEEVSASDARARLFQLLIAPLGDVLEGVTTIIVVPDREIHRVPFAALWDASSQKYAVESYEFRTVPSVGYLLAANVGERKSLGAESPVVVGNPTQSVAGGRALGRLPGADKEARDIAQLYPQSTQLSGDEATQARVIEALATASSLHFAGHAVFDEDRPELSYLALASDSASEGRLSAREIGSLRLSHLRLVVLSACSTLNPRSTRNGPVAGLAYSFLRAQAPALISTLWDVRDDASATLLVAFHRRLVQHERPSEALRKTQLEALHSQSSQMRIPRSWAAFTYTGP